MSLPVTYVIISWADQKTKYSLLREKVLKIPYVSRLLPLYPLLLFIHWWRGSSLETYWVFNTFSRNNEYLLTFLIEKTLRNTVFFLFWPENHSPTWKIWWQSPNYFNYSRFKTLKRTKPNQKKIKIHNITKIWVDSCREGKWGRESLAGNIGRQQR